MPSQQKFSRKPLARATRLLTEMLTALRAPGPVEAPVGAANKIVTRQTIFVSRSGPLGASPEIKSPPSWP